ncbi:MAG: helix-turn-helix transcriptional regulator [Spirochaetota bacterium]
MNAVFLAISVSMFSGFFSLGTVSFLDGLSLPAYRLVLNTGSFFFAGKFLNSDPLVEPGRLTEHLLDGSTNQDLADALCISRKTVENHLYNVFQKMQVRNRVQLIATLRVWNRETRE